MNDNNKVSFWVKIIESIDKPLGFFVLALLIVETFLGVILLSPKFPDDKRFYGMILGVGMFFTVVITVALLVWHKPHNLIYDKEAHLADTGKLPYGSNNNPISNLDLLTPTQTQGNNSIKKEVIS